MIKFTHNEVRMTKNRKQAFLSAHFYAGILGLAKKSVLVEIHFKHDYLKTFDTFAVVDCKCTTHLIIEIDSKLSQQDMLRTMAHEMVHVKQYIKGELSEDKKGFQLWKGHHVPECTQYHELPWEMEAMKKETIMFWQYIYARDGKT